LRKQPSDLDYVVLGQFSSSILFSAIRSAVPKLISFVLGVRPPAQILDPVVRGVSVKMSTLVSNRAWTNKGFEYDSMNPHVLAASSGPEIDMKMSVGVVDARFENAPDSRAVCRPDALDAPMVGDLIDPLIPDGRKPVFSVDSGSGSGDIHGSLVSRARGNLPRRPRALIL